MRLKQINVPNGIPKEEADRRAKAKLQARIRIEPSGCHIWTGAVNTKGYGEVSIQNKRHKAHRLAYTLYKGPIPKGMLVCHECDTPRCCNPDHLWLGSIWENGQDAKRKKRCKYQKADACVRGHKWADGNYRLTKEGFKQCLICARIRSRLHAGWTEEQAKAFDVVPAGVRPVGAKWQRSASRR